MLLVISLLLNNQEPQLGELYLVGLYCLSFGCLYSNLNLIAFSFVITAQEVLNISHLASLLRLILLPPA
jgi:hypothetical protein